MQTPIHKRLLLFLSISACVIANTNEKKSFERAKYIQEKNAVYQEKDQNALLERLRARYQAKKKQKTVSIYLKAKDIQAGNIIDEARNVAKGRGDLKFNIYFLDAINPGGLSADTLKKVLGNKPITDLYKKNGCCSKTDQVAFHFFNGSIPDYVKKTTAYIFVNFKKKKQVIYADRANLKSGLELIEKD